MNTKFERIKFRISRWSELTDKWGVLLSVMLMMLMITSDIFIRTVFKTSFFAIHDLVQFLLLIAIFSSVSYCWILDGHVRMRLVHSKLGAVGREAVNAVSALSGIFVFGLLAVACVLFLIDDIELKTQTDLANIPFYPFRIYMILGSLLFVVQLTVSFVDSIIKIKCYRRERAMEVQT